MAEFNKKEFGNNIRKARKSKGWSIENLALELNKNISTISRYETGSYVPNAIEIANICNVLGINEYELFNSNLKINNHENTKNPFKNKTLYIAYMSYFQKSNKYDLAKFKLKITEKPDRFIVDLIDYKTNKIYMSGYFLSDNNIATFILENYKENNLRFEVTQIILNISKGTNSFMLGSICGTNSNYSPSIRKCLVSETDFELSNKILELIKINDIEKNQLKENEILYLDLMMKEDFEE